MVKQPFRALLGLLLIAALSTLYSLFPQQARFGLSTFQIGQAHFHPAMEDISTCPFCTIAANYPPASSHVPEAPDSELITPNCHLILSTPQVLAFLDILPITQGHVLVIPREHREKLKDLRGSQGAALGAWLPVVSRATMRALGRGEGDWNIVQNNGAVFDTNIMTVDLHMRQVPLRPKSSLTSTIISFQEAEMCPT